MRKPLILVRRLVVAAALTLLVACATVPGEGTPSTPAPADAETLLAQGDAALARGELPEAARAYRLAADASDDEAVAEQATRVAFDNFQFGEASRAADRWLALNPSSEQAERYAGVSALALHRLDEAEEHFARLIETAYISTAAGFLALLPVMMDEGNPPDVTELFRRLAARHPTLAEGQVALGTAALRSDNYALAMQSAQRAVELAPYWVPAKLLLARTQIASGQEDLGLATVRDVVTAPGSDVATHIEYALLLAGTGRDDEARAVLTPYASGQVVVPAAVRSLGLMDAPERRSQGGRGPVRGPALDGVAVLRIALLPGRHRRASRRHRARDELLFPRRERRPRDRGPAAGCAHQGRKVGRGCRARASSGVRSRPADTRAAGRDGPRGPADVVRRSAPCGRSARRRARPVSRTCSTCAWRASLPTSVTARATPRSATCASCSEDRPGDPVVQNALGYTLADQNRQLPEAQALIEAGLAQMPDSAAVLDSMGWVLYRQKRYEQALGYLKRAYELGDDSEIAVHLGEVQWAMGDKAAAHKTWEEALKRHPGNKPLEERLARPVP